MHILQVALHHKIMMTIAMLLTLQPAKQTQRTVYHLGVVSFRHIYGYRYLNMGTDKERTSTSLCYLFILSLFMVYVNIFEGVL